MTRCVACDCNLSDYESTRKIEEPDGKIVYPDLCNKCFKSSGLEKISNVFDRDDLIHIEDISTTDFINIFDDNYYLDDDSEPFF